MACRTVPLLGMKMVAGGGGGGGGAGTAAGTGANRRRTVGKSRDVSVFVVTSTQTTAGIPLEGVTLLLCTHSSEKSCTHIASYHEVRQLELCALLEGTSAVKMEPFQLPAESLN